MNELEQALIEAVEILESLEIPYMVIGGVANAVWGEPRSTLDVDLAIWAGNRELPPILDRLRVNFTIAVPDPERFIGEAHSLPLRTARGIGIDLIFGKHPIHKSGIHRAIERPIAGRPVRFCSPEDLVLLKAISDRSKDLADVKEILIRRWSELDMNYIERWLRSISDAFAEDSILRTWDRLKSEAAMAAHGEPGAESPPNI